MFNPFSNWSTDDLLLADMSDVMDVACEYAAIEAAELVGPSGHEYQALCESLVHTRYWGLANGWLASEQRRRGIVFASLEDL